MSLVFVGGGLESTELYSGRAISWPTPRDLKENILVTRDLLLSFNGITSYSLQMGSPHFLPCPRQWGHTNFLIVKLTYIFNFRAGAWGKQDSSLVARSLAQEPRSWGQESAFCSGETQTGKGAGLRGEKCARECNWSTCETRAGSLRSTALGHMAGPPMLAPPAWG